MTLGSEKIALNGNTFTVEKEGVYAVRFTAVDEAGNYAELDPVYIRVTGESGNTGLIVGLSVGGAVVVAAAVVLTVVLIKKSKKKNADGIVSENGSNDASEQ